MYLTTPAGPQEYKGFVLKTGERYDAKEARDVVVDIIDSTYFMFYKAQREVKNVKTGLAISHDGIH
ncbi:MAG: hypothetical protein DRN04_05320 [Thermoprotei archaeon]|nr:MAG: hypothetical protein DRN04_05320 [Thermoprotei archaeon]